MYMQERNAKTYLNDSTHKLKDTQYFDNYTCQVIKFVNLIVVTLHSKHRIEEIQKFTQIDE
jgi:hypothetical protein